MRKLWSRKDEHRPEHRPEVNLFGGIANVRPRVNVSPQEAPDPIRQGDTPSRPAVMPAIILTGMNPDSVAEGRFVASILSPHPHASYPRGRMTPDRSRSNIKVPPHIAYGSLFSDQSAPYGLG